MIVNACDGSRCLLEVFFSVQCGENAEKKDNLCVCFPNYYEENSGDAYTVGCIRNIGEFRFFAPIITTNNYYY